MPAVPRRSRVRSDRTGPDRRRRGGRRQLKRLFGWAERRGKRWARGDRSRRGRSDSENEKRKRPAACLPSIRTAARREDSPRVSNETRVTSEANRDCSPITPRRRDVVTVTIQPQQSTKQTNGCDALSRRASSSSSSSSSYSTRIPGPPTAGRLRRRPALPWRLARFSRARTNTEPLAAGVPNKRAPTEALLLLLNVVVVVVVCRDSMKDAAGNGTRPANARRENSQCGFVRASIEV
jgi:hypothetical protein